MKKKFFNELIAGFRVISTITDLRHTINKILNCDTLVERKIEHSKAKKVIYEKHSWFAFVEIQF